MRKIATSLGLALVLALACGLEGCSKGGAPPSGQSGVPQLSEAELKYGQSVTRSDQVVYQDDVVIVDHGADAIHDLSSDGLTWTIDGNAPHAQEIVPGKVMFLTSRAVGRVLGVKHNGNDLAVTVGPVEITDVIKEGHLSAQEPIDIGSMIAYVGTDLPGTIYTPPTTGPASSPAPQNSLRTPSSRVANFSRPFIAFGDPANGVEMASASFAGANLFELIAPALAQAPLGPPANIDVGDFSVTPFCCGGIGMKAEHSANGLHILIEAVVYLDKPSIGFDLDIRGGVIRTAEVTLNGVAGLLMQFEAGSANGLTGNLSKEFAVPIDLSWPIYGLPVPFAVTLHQTLVIKTGFSSKNSTLSAIGHYQFRGSFYMGYHQGSWRAGSPMAFHIVRSLPDSISGLSLGTSAFLMGYQAKVIVGIGAFGFATGPYIGYGVSAGVTKAGAVMHFSGPFPECRTADLDVALHVGVGYSIPQPVTSAINFVLRALNLRPINSFGGLEHKEGVIQKHSAYPQGCG